MLEIRPAKPEDAEQIAQVHVTSWQTTYQKIVDEEILGSMNWKDRVESWHQTIETLQDNAIIFGAFKEDKLVGFLSGGASRKPLGDCDAEIYAIYLLEEYRGEGIGKQLMDTYFKWLKEKRFHSCFVWIAEENPYQTFYSALGAKKTEHRSVARIRSNQIPTVAYIWDNISLIS